MIVTIGNLTLDCNIVERYTKEEFTKAFGSSFIGNAETLYNNLVNLNNGRSKLRSTGEKFQEKNIKRSRRKQKSTPTDRKSTEGAT